jgi:competence protein ComEC
MTGRLVDLSGVAAALTRHLAALRRRAAGWWVRAGDVGEAIRRCVPLRETPLPSRPLVVMAVCFAVGCAIAVAAADASDGALPCGTLAAAAWWAAAAALAGWWLARCHDHPRTAVVSLCLAVATSGTAWAVAQVRLFPADDLAWELSETPVPMAIRGTVLDAARRLPGLGGDAREAAAIGPSSRCLVQVEEVREATRWRPASGRASMLVAADEPALAHLVSGVRVQILGRALRPRGARNPGEYDIALRALAERCLSVVRVRSPDDITVLGQPAWWAGGWIDRLRGAGAAALRRCLGDDRVPLADALLLGRRESLSREAAEQFLVTGTIHLLSISGLHVGLIAWALFRSLRWLPIPHWVVLLAVAGCAGLYMLLVRAETPVVRATLAVWLACGAAAVARRPAMVTALAVAGLVVLFRRPSDIAAAGPQLSFLATATLLGIAALKPGRTTAAVDPIERLIVRSRPPWERWLRRRAAEAWSVFIAGAVVWAVTAPLVAQRFHVVSPVGLLLNVVVAPLVAAAMAGGFLCLMLAAVAPPLAVAPGAVCDASLALLSRFVAWGAALPGGHLWVAGPPAWWVAGWYVLLAGALVLLSPAAMRRPRMWVALAAAWCGCGWVGDVVTRFVAPPPAALRVVAAAVGHGCSILVRAPGGGTLLYDAGALGTPAAASRAICGLLWSERLTRIDTLVISHADADHFNAVPELLERFTVGRLLVPESLLRNRSPSVAALVRRAGARGVPVQVVAAGDAFALTSLCRVRVLHPAVSVPTVGLSAAAESAEPGALTERARRSADNETSVVLAVETAGRRLLLTGDLEGAALRRFVTSHTEWCDVLVAPHHGSRTSLPADIASVTAPAVVLVSGTGGSAWPVVAEAYRGAAARARQAHATAARHPHVEVLRTGHEGAVAVMLTAAGVRTARWSGRWREGGPIHHRSDLDDLVGEPADTVDGDRDAVADREGERVVGHDTGAGEEDDTVRECLGPPEMIHEVGERAADAIDRRAPAEHLVSRTFDCHADRPAADRGLDRFQHDPRAERARAIVDLRLWQVEQVLALDVARTHVVADRAAHEPPAGVHHECEFRLGHAPPRIAADADGVVRPHHLLGD